MRYSYYEFRQLLQNASILLENATVITKCVNFITKYDSCYQMCRLLQNAFVPIQRIFIIEYLEYLSFNTIVLITHPLSQPVFTCSKSAIETSENWKLCQIVSNLTRNIPERWRHSDVVIVNFQQILLIVEVFSLLTVSK